MSRLASNLIVGLAVLLLAGAGWYLVAKNRLASEIAVANAAQGRELVQLRTENRQLKDRLNTATETVTPVVEAVPTPPAPNPTARARIASDLVRSGLLGQVTWPNPDRNSLESGMKDLAEILGLSATETTALQQAAEAGRQAFAAALLAHASVQRAGTMVTITVADEPQVRAPYDQMLASLATVLGPERYGLFETLGARAANEKLFDRWGRGGTTLMVSHATSIPDAFYPPSLDAAGNPTAVPTGRSRGDPSGRLLYYFTQIKPGQRGGGGTSGTDSIEHVGTNVGPLHALIPPDL